MLYAGSAEAACPGLLPLHWVCSHGFSSTLMLLHGGSGWMPTPKSMETGNERGSGKRCSRFGYQPADFGALQKPGSTALGGGTGQYWDPAVGRQWDPHSMPCIPPLHPALSFQQLSASEANGTFCLGALAGSILKKTGSADNACLLREMLQQSSLPAPGSSCCIHPAPRGE